MIQGMIIGLEARVPIQFRGPNKQNQTVQATVDSGFDGYISLPPDVISLLRLRWKSEGRGILADGSESRFDVYDATIQWHGQTRRVPVFAIGTSCLIGMSLLYGCECNLKVRPHGLVTIKKLRNARRR
jgi:clan AA aspartic protease